MQNQRSFGQEQIATLVEKARKLKQMGATEENNSEFRSLIQMLQVLREQRRLQQPTSNTLNPQQMGTLRYQVQSYKQLQQGEPLSAGLAKQVQNPPPEPESIASKIVNSGFKKLKPPEKSPYSFYTRPATAGDLNQRMLVPAVLPVAIDPIDLKHERERMISDRVQERIAQLAQVSANITNDNDMKMKALIELKSLQLLSKQQKLRTEILQAVSKATTLNTAIDRASFRRLKKQTLREARQTEKTERALRGEKEKRERQKHLDYLNSILTHGRDFVSYHRGYLGKMQKLGSAVVRFHSAALKEEERRLQKHSQERLNALKANDEEAYMKLIDKTKDTRITTILNQTTQFLTTLTSAMEKQKQSVDLMAGGAVENTTGDQQEDAPADYYSSAHQITEIVTEQSSLLVGGTLKDYQLKGLEWMVSLYNNRLNGILADEMGLGKTIQTLALITYLIEKKKQPGPFLVIVPLSTLTNWILEFEKWAPSVIKIAYKGGSADTRRNLANQIRAGNFNVLLTTYEYIINPKDRPVLSKVKWVHMIIDEGHRMKNANSKLSITLMQFYSARYRIILTGTPLQNNLPELWALLNFILPKIFNSVKSFDEWFNSPFNASSIQERIELNEEEQLLIIKRLHKVLRPFLLRRLKKDVESELPDKVEIVIKCPMSALQQKLTEQIRNRQFGSGNSLGKKKALNNLVMQFRKICNHPYVFDEVEDALNPSRVTDRNLFRVAGKFELLDRILPKFKALDHRVLMFFQMTQIMDIMEDYLRWKGITYLRLDGHTKAEDRTDMLKAFNREENPPFMFLLSTRAGGLGLNLQSADTVIIYDSDWNPHQDLQAQDRAHRIGQKKEVRILRFVTSKSVEETILARAQYKLDIDGKVIQAGKFDNKTSDREREELLRSLFGGEDEEEADKKEQGDGYLDDDELNEIIARNEEELEIYTKMDAERRKQEQEQWEEMGGSGELPPRLMPETELPEVFLANPDDNLPAPVEVLGKGARRREKVAYDDGLNDEEQWLDAVDEGDVDGFINRKKQQKEENEARRQRIKENHARRRAAGEDVNSDDEDYEDDSNPYELPDPEIEEPIPRKSRKRERVEESTPQVTMPAKKRGRKKKPFADVDPDMVDMLSPEAREQLRSIIQSCYDAVVNLEVQEEDYTRKRCELFLELPSKTEFADYYQIIREPIALDMIQHRINSPYYPNKEAFRNDMLTMFSNAMQYNVEGSFVYEDAVEMKKVFDATFAKYVGHTQNPQIAKQPPVMQQFPAAQPIPVVPQPSFDIGAEIQQMQAAGLRQTVNENQMNQGNHMPQNGQFNGMPGFQGPHGY